MKIKETVLYTTIILLLLLSMTVIRGSASSSEYEYTICEDGIILTHYNGESKHVTVPPAIDGKNVIGIEGAFKDNRTVETVVLPEGITVIGKHTFYQCANLKKVTIPESVTTIDDYAFAYSGIKRLSLPRNTHYINEGAFKGCKKLTGIISDAEPIAPGEKALYIGEYAFDASRIGAIKTAYTPEYSKSSFNIKCVFTEKTFNYNIYSSNVTAFIRVHSQTPLNTALWSTTLAFGAMTLIIIDITLFIGLQTLMKKNKVVNYLKYGSRQYNSMTISDHSGSFVYSPHKSFVKQIIKKYLKIIILIFALFCFMVLDTYVANYLMDTFEMPHNLGTVCLLLAAVALVCVIVIVLLFVLWFIVKMSISYIKINNADKPRIRIQKIR